MKVIDSFPHRVREIENTWIPMPDGCRLAARIWLPENAEAQPVPAIIEYIPYRKRDHTRTRDDPMHRYFAGHGYASVRIDVRGSGESDGVLLDEYTTQEHDDGLAAIRWVAVQPWCTGAVGMMGKSWGGFNSLQIAALRPPELKAVIAACATDDRYADDAHYMGGCLLNENLVWGSVLFTLNALPPDPELVGERWREMWLERLENTPLFPEIWLRHQRRDDYWKHGSVAEDLARISCPVYAISGWADGYTNAVPRLLAGLEVPCKGLVGPWAHVYPHEGVPGPAIGFLQEALRWFDHWLRGVDTGIMDEPAYRVWMQESVRPQSHYVERPGRWVAETTWPSPRIQSRRFLLTPCELAPAEADSPIEETRLDISSPQNTGLAAGSWCGFGVQGELPSDQREDDGKSLVFDSAPLAERLEILGAPQLTLEFSADRPCAFVVARLNDVGRDGSSTRVTYGLLNLTHRAGHEEPEPLQPSERYRATLRLNDIAHAFAPGHRIRLGLSTCYWPVVWPSPEPVTLGIYTGSSHIELPVRPARPGDELLRPFEAPEAAAPVEEIDLNDVGMRRRVEHDLASGVTVYSAAFELDESGALAISRLDPIDLEFGHGIIERFTIRAGDPLSARTEVIEKAVARRREWNTRVETRMNLTADRDDFRLEAKLVAYEGESSVFSRSWATSIPRDHV